MSHSTLYLVYKTRVKTLAMSQNSYGTATPLWDYLTTKYLGRESGSWLWEDNIQWLWNAAEDERIPGCLRLAHAFTFDMALCTTENRERLAQACYQTHEILKETLDQGVDSEYHWNGIGRAIDSAVIDQRCLGIGLTGASVNDLWQQYPQNRREPWDMFSWFDSIK